MIRRVTPTAVGLVILVSIACGKRGNPLPPLRPVPARIVGAAAVRTVETTTITFTVPAANLDGTVPPSVTRVDVYEWIGAAGAVVPAAGVISGERRNLRRSVNVSQVVEGVPVPAGAVVPGAVATLTGVLKGVDPTKAALAAYVLVPMARNRRGPPSAPVVVPLGALPAPPTNVRLASTATEVWAAWQPATKGQTFRVVRTTEAGVPVDGAPLNAKPLTAESFSFPVEFGRQVCVAVRPVVMDRGTALEGTLSAPACLTPEDRYAPAAPTGLQVVQDGAAVTLLWTGVDAADLAGYVVLRGADSDAALQPLMRTPIRETSYRDTDVRPGVTYVYAVYAADTATPSNVSQLSARQSVTVR